MARREGEADRALAMAASDHSGKLLAHADFRRLWTVGLASFLVRWLEILVFGVFAYQVTGSAFIVTLLTMLRILPLGLFGLLLGVVAARVDRRIGLIVSVAVSLLSSLVLLGLSLTDQLQVWHLGVASFVNGVVWSGDNPVRRGLMGDLAGPLRMGNAMALDVGASNACRLAGPASGGFLFAQGGMTAVFAFTVVLYLVALLAVLRVNPQPPSGGASRLPMRALLASGFVAARQSPTLAATLWLTIIFNLFGFPVLSLVPVLGKDLLGLDPDGVGALMSLEGLGAMAAAFAMAMWARAADYGRIFVLGCALFLSMLPIVGHSGWLPLTVIAMVTLGMGQAGFSVMQSTLAFVASPPDRRMPAMGLLTVCVGLGPIGFLSLGWLAERLGASTAAALLGGAGIVLIGASWPWWRVCWQRPPPGPSPVQGPASSAGST